MIDDYPFWLAASEQKLMCCIVLHCGGVIVDYSLSLYHIVLHCIGGVRSSTTFFNKCYCIVLYLYRIVLHWRAVIVDYPFWVAAGEQQLLCCIVLHCRGVIVDNPFWPAARENRYCIVLYCVGGL